MQKERSNAVNQRSAFLGMRASTTERLLVEQLQHKLNAPSASAVIRALVAEKATALGMN